MKSKTYLVIALLILAGSFVSWQQASARITPLAVETSETEGLTGTTPTPPTPSTPIPGAGAFISAPVSVRLNPIPTSADIVYLRPRSIPPDGTPIVPGGGSSDIWVMDDTGGNATQITFDNPRNYEHVAVSFGRRYVVANQPDPTGAKGSILYLLDLQNDTEQKLVPDFHSAGGGGVDISVDGYVYVGCQEVNEPRTDLTRFMNSFDICKIALDGSSVTKLILINDGDIEADVAVSEDGTLVTSAIAAAAGTGVAHSEIRVYNNDGTNIRTPHVATPPVGSYDPTISPDNTKVAFSRENAAVPPNWPGIGGLNIAHDIAVANVDGTGSLLRLTKPGSISIIPNWKGDRIVYTEMSDAVDWWGASIVNDHDADQAPLRIKQYAVTPKWIPQASAGNLSGSIVYVGNDATGPQLFSSDLQGGQVRQLTDSEGDKSGAVRSRDGKRIAFAWRPAGQWEIWVMDDDGGNETRLVTGAGDNIPSSWSPDGNQILFTSNRNGGGGFEIYVVDADGSNERRLTTTVSGFPVPMSASPDWSPDGSQIVFMSNRGGSGFHIYVMDADGSNVKQLTQPLLPDFPDAAVPAWSPAPGGKIIFWNGIEGRHGEIGVIDADGSNRRQLTDQPGEENNDDPAWSSDGHYIIFTTSRSRVRVETWVMDTDGSNERLLFPNGGFGGRLPWHRSDSGDSESPAVSDAALSKKKVKRKSDPTLTITWTSSDNTAVASHDILFAEDGANFSTTVIAGLAGNEQSFTWTVPDSLPKTGSGRIKIIARDAEGNAGEAVSGKLKIK